MIKAYSEDLRCRVLKAIEGGMSAEQAATNFQVSVSTARLWARRQRKYGETSPRRPGKPRGMKLDEHADFILSLVEILGRKASLSCIVGRLDTERGVQVSLASVWKFLHRRGLTRGKRLIDDKDAKRISGRP